MLKDHEISEKIRQFPHWHYEFNLRGHRTPIFQADHRNRHKQRRKYFFDPLVASLGGSLAEKRVLDLGCNAGFWSLAAIETGCDFVLGIDGRQMHVDQANFVFRVKGVAPGRYRFATANIFEFDFSQLGAFDVVLCLGLLYHVSKPVELFERIAPLNSDLLVIDTALSRATGSFFEVRHDPLDDPRMAVDYPLVLLPTAAAVFELARGFGYATSMLRPQFEDWEGCSDYRDGTRRAFVCGKRALPRSAFDVEMV